MMELKLFDGADADEEDYPATGCPAPQKASLAPPRRSWQNPRGATGQSWL